MNICVTPDYNSGCIMNNCSYLVHDVRVMGSGDRVHGPDWRPSLELMSLLNRYEDLTHVSMFDTKFSELTVPYPITKVQFEKSWLQCNVRVYI